MINIENYDIVFSRDTSLPNEPEVVLLVLEQSDLPQISTCPEKILLTDDVITKKSLDIVFKDNIIVRCKKLPEELFESLIKFSNIIFCIMDKEKIVSETTLKTEKA